jgi:hypothetical protein
VIIFNLFRPMRQAEAQGDSFEGLPNFARMKILLCILGLHAPSRKWVIYSSILLAVILNSHEQLCLIICWPESALIPGLMLMLTTCIMADWHYKEHSSWVPGLAVLVSRLRQHVIAVLAVYDKQRAGESQRTWSSQACVANTC